MVASPEVCRMNGAKSKGPKTERGKAIASRNATKHGLLAQQPPLLATEDLETFEGLVQGLIDHYEPENPVEHFLVQQVAMGMLKQYRLWNVETAIANIEVLKAKQLAEFPDHVKPPAVELNPFAEYRETRTPLKTLLENEKDILEGLVADLDYDISHAQEVGEKKTLAAIRESIDQNFHHEDRSTAVWRYQTEFDIWLSQSWDGRKKRYMADLSEAINRARHLVDLANQRIVEIDYTLSRMKAVEQAIQQAQVAKEGIQEPLLFTRYQTAISRHLYDALERLEAMKGRKNQDSMGSFGKSMAVSE